MSSIRSRESGNAFTALRKRARKTPSSFLITLESAGLAATLGIATWAPDLWPLALPLLALSSFGVWGVTDRFIVDNRRQMDPLLDVALRTFRLSVAVAGTGCGAAALLLAVGKAMGTI